MADRDLLWKEPATPEQQDENIVLLGLRARAELAKRGKVSLESLLELRECLRRIDKRAKEDAEDRFMAGYLLEAIILESKR